MSYGIPSFHYKGGLVGYAAFKNHWSFFPINAALIDSLEEDLKEYRSSKGTLQFALDKPLPPALLKKMVKGTLPTTTGGQGRNTTMIQIQLDRVFREV